MNLDQYKTTNETAFFKNVPIEYLPLVRAYFKKEGVKIRVRYRGQRNHPEDIRPSYQRWNWCLPQFADRFSIYLEGRTNRVYKPYEPPKQFRKYFTFHEAVMVERTILADSLEEAKRACPSGFFVSMRDIG